MIPGELRATAGNHIALGVNRQIWDQLQGGGLHANNRLGYPLPVKFVPWRSQSTILA